VSLAVKLVRKESATNAAGFSRNHHRRSDALPATVATHEHKAFARYVSDSMPKIKTVSVHAGTKWRIRILVSSS